MSEPRRCPQCDAEIPVNSPAGLCPRCLLKASADSQSAAASAEPGVTKLTPPASGFVPPTVEELAPLFPQLEILELLGKGGMGAVYKARQPGLDRLVAVKILPPEISRDPAFTERFQREARALARLSHPHIVAVYDFGVVGQAFQSDAFDRSGQAGKPDLRDGLCYIVMEFVDGANLRQTIRVGKLAAAEALAIVPQICEALQFAHDEGIVHRDIKPENILIDKRGRVKIADFGLAKLLGQDASDHSLTATHQVMGTLRYMAPEQMQGSREVDHRADIYSLGVVFYELLTGELPMGKFAPPSKRVQVDVRLDEIVLRALEQDPEQRYQHASEVKTDVEIISRSPSAARPESAKGVSTQPTEPTWETWWFEHSLASRKMMKNVLLTAAIVCLAILVSIEGRFGASTDGKTSIRIGFGDSWFWYSTAEGSRIDLLSWSFGLGALGVFLSVAWFRVRRAERRHAAEVAGVASSSHRQPESLARPESAKGAATGPDLVQAPADCLLLAAGIAFVTACGVALWLLASPTRSLITSLIRGNLTIASVTLATYSLFIGVAGLMLRRLRVRLFVLLVAVVVGSCLPAVIALNVVMEFRNTHEWLVAIPLWLGMPAALWVVVTLFRDDVRRAFDAAAEQRAKRSGTEKTGERQGVSPPSESLDAGLGGLTPSRSPSGSPNTRPKLVPVLATFNLLGAIVLMLVSAMEQPAAFAESVPRLWQVWEKIDCVLGFVTAAGLFAASIGLFLWKPWARKLTLGVCVFSLATFVFDAPYLARFVLPDFYAEIQLMLAVEAVDPDLLDLIALGIVVGLIGIPMLVALACLIGQLVYFTRPRVVAAFESLGERLGVSPPRRVPTGSTEEARWADAQPLAEKPGKFIEWLFTGTGAVLGVLSVFAPLALLLGLAAFFNAGDGEKTVDPSAGRAGSKTGEVWSGNKGAEHVMFWGPNSPTVSDRLAQHLGLDATQRAAMDQALQKFFREFRALEEQATRHETDAKGHQITTIAPLLQAHPQLAERFWSELDSALDGRQLTLGRKTVGLQTGMFETGDYGYRIEIWRVGQVNPWFHWAESYPGRANVSQNVSSSAADLPEKLRRFWTEPPREVEKKAQ